MIAGLIWALLTHRDQLDLIVDGKASWADGFEEYVRWMAPIGMTPRRIDKAIDIGAVHLNPDDKIFFMFSSANHDEDVFDHPEVFDIMRENSNMHIAFGAGPHFCAGAAASKTLIAEIALPTIFCKLKKLRLQKNAKVEIGGWAFRGVLNLPVEWD